MSNKPIRITFDANRRSLATGRTGKTHTISACDGDILLT